jgi:hypothetical protein
LASSARPQRNHHQWPVREHPGTLMIDALPPVSPIGGHIMTPHRVKAQGRHRRRRWAANDDHRRPGKRSAKASADCGLGAHHGVPRTPTLTLAAGTPAEQLGRLAGRTLLCHQDVLGPFDQRRGFQPGSAEHPDMDGQRLHRAPVRIRAERRFARLNGLAAHLMSPRWVTGPIGGGVTNRSPAG